MSVISAFRPVFSTKATGDITIASNTLMTSGESFAESVQRGDATPSNRNDNQNNNMVYVNVDRGGGGFNSSSADLVLPAGATILFAGLDWGGTSTSPQASEALLKTPGSSDYRPINATNFDTYVYNGTAGDVPNYSGFTDVTSLVRAAGAGTYTVANVQSIQGRERDEGYYAGWALVVVYGALGLPARDLTVFNGYASVSASPGNNAVPITISGFGAPPLGPVDATVGVVAYEGDINLPGDSLTFDSTILGDAASPSNNFFNSGISSRGGRVTSKNPNYRNQTGIDAKLVSANGIIQPSATSATLTLRTDRDLYLPSIVTTAIDLGDADLGVTKTVDNPTPNVGDTISFTVGLSNNGPDAASGVVVADVLPAGLQFVSATPGQGAYDPAAGVWTVGSVAAGQTLTLVVQARVASPGQHTNVAAIQRSDQYDPNPHNNIAAGTVTPQESDLAVAKTVDNPTPNVGESIVYTIYVMNVGPNTATGVVVADVLPAGLQFVSAAPSQGSYDPATGVWNVGSVPVSRGPVLLSITALATAVGAGINTVTIARSDQYDPNPDNNTASSETDPRQADLALYKFVDNPRPNVGDTITFTVGLWNYGPSAATSVTVGDVLPAGLQFVDATASAGVYDRGTNVWTLGTVPVDLAREIRTLMIRAVVVSPGRTTNTASVLTSDQSDPNPNNNRSSSVVTPQVADLRVGKIVDNPAPSLGDSVEFLIGIGNLGPDGATGVTLQDRLPAGFQFVSSTPSQGTYDPATGVWTVGAVAVGDRPTLVIRAVAVAAGTQINTATIAGSDQYDPTPGESASVATTVVTTEALAPTVVGLQRFGYHAQPTELVLTFSTALDASTAEDVANYQLNQIVGRRIGRAISISSAAYDEAAQTVSLHPARRLSLFARYRLLVNGSSSTGVAGVTGAPLDGRGDGTPGTDYVATFGREILAGRSRPARVFRPVHRVRPVRPSTFAPHRTVRLPRAAPVPGLVPSQE